MVPASTTPMPPGTGATAPRCRPDDDHHHEHGQGKVVTERSQGRAQGEGSEKLACGLTGEHYEFGRASGSCPLRQERQVGLVLDLLEPGQGEGRHVSAMEDPLERILDKTESMPSCSFSWRLCQRR